jgi:hypothetical protein
MKDRNEEEAVRAVFQRPRNEAGEAGGGIVEVPPGRFRINGNLTVPANVTLQGIDRVPPTSGPTPIDKLTGSVQISSTQCGRAATQRGATAPG